MSALTAHSRLTDFYARSVGLSLPDFLTIIILILTAILVIMTYILLLLAARPHIVTHIFSKKSFLIGEEAIIKFTLYNRKSWYGKSPATHVTAYINFHENIEPLEVRYGSNLEKVDKEYRRGKEKSKYFTVKDIALSPDERDAGGRLLGEDILTIIHFPEQPGDYWVRIVVFTDQNSSHSVRFPLLVRISSTSATIRRIQLAALTKTKRYKQKLLCQTKR